MSQSKKSAVRTDGSDARGAPVLVAAEPAAPPQSRALSVADAFHLLRVEAEAVAPEVAVPFGADLPLALHNVRMGVEAILPHAARIAADLPNIPLPQVLALPNYVRGVIHADSKSSAPRAVTRDDIAANLAALQGLRVPTILQLQVFKYKKLIDAITVDDIVAGRGTLNFAQDGIDIARVFTENRDAWRGKHPFTDAEIAELGRLGNWLLDHVQPDGATARPATPNEYDLLRRQFWALVVTLHRHLRTIGVVLWGEDGVDAHVPKLQTRVVTRSSGATDDPPADPVTPPVV